MFGANLAEFRLTQAILNRRGTLTWEVWDRNIAPSLTGARDFRRDQQDVYQLRRQFGDRVQLRDLSKLVQLAEDRAYIFLSNTATFCRISELRKRVGAQGLPICAVTHSLYTSDCLFDYAWLQLSTEPQDVIVVSSQAARKALENLLAIEEERLTTRLKINRWALPRPRIVQIPFGTEFPDESDLNRDQARILFKISSRAFVILYFGRLSEEYKADLDPLLEAVQHLSTTAHDVWLVIAGQSSNNAYSKYLQARAVALGMEERYICVENCPEFLKSSLYAACDVMVSPADSIQETFGLALLEAMAHARPVIATRWSGYPELLEDGKTGFLIRTMWSQEASDRASLLVTLAHPALVAHYLAQRTIMDCGELIEKLTLLADNPDLRIAMGEAGRARVKAHYTWPHIADRFLALWEEQLERCLAPKTKLATEHLSCFEHYADTLLTPNDLIARIPGEDEYEANMLEQWKFSDRDNQSRLRILLAITSANAVSIGELRHMGFELDCILWLAKKGIRRIVKMPLEA
jgi:glycosyltransferase involved in cell wall biosynthesis